MPILPFLGQGIGFPFRIDSSKGGAKITSGKTDHVSVSLAYLTERWTIRERLNEQENHIAEAIAHILTTHRGEHDTLPSFGGDTLDLIFEPNHPAFHMLAEHYFVHSTERWEKRAKIPAKKGVTFNWQGDLVERGIMPISATISFITEQTSENLVSPFVTPRLARAAEYPTGTTDTVGHDWLSRYKNYDVYRYGEKIYIRPRYPEYLPPAPDDIFYKVKAGDSWLLVADNVYKDIRYHWIVTQTTYIDAAKNGDDRAAMYRLFSDPTPGEYLRLPTRNRALMGIIA